MRSAVVHHKEGAEHVDATVAVNARSVARAVAG